jgi:hypothetical protein
VLVSKTVGDEMKKVLNDATEMVTFIKQRQVHSRTYKNPCEKTGQTAHKSATYKNPVT